MVIKIQCLVKLKNLIHFFNKHHTEETKQKLHNIHVGKHYSPDTEFKKGQVDIRKDKHHTEKSKIKMSISKKEYFKSFPEKIKRRKDHPNYGKLCSDKTIEKLRISNSGENNPFFNHHHTLESKLKNSETHKKYFKLFPEKILKLEKHPSWLGGKSFEPYCKKFNNSLKELIRIRDNHTCQLCGKIQTERRFSPHHIHYLKSDCYPDLILLCTSCNAKVNFNRSYYESLFMNKLNDRELLFWTRRNI